jgi:RNA polymerase sigma-70 factor, ECF subfamily
MRGHNGARTLRWHHPVIRPVPRPDQARHLSDQALVALAERGDAAAVGEFYDRYGRVAYGLALRVLGDTRSAEAVVEDAFALVGRTNARIGTSGTRASTWILALVHRQAVERLRNTHRAGEARPPVEGTTGGGDGWCGLQSEHVHHALDQLTDAEREMLVLAYYEGLTVSELAARLDQTLDAVKAMLHAGLSRLRDALAEETMPIGALAQAGPEHSAPARERRRRWRFLPPERKHRVR